MRTSAMPKTVAKWLDRNSNTVESANIERDEFGESHEGPYSIWLYLADGWVNTDGGGTIIHEPTARGFLDAVKFIERLPQEPTQ